MKRIALISDTHMPAGTLPLWVRENISQADHTIHTGDFETRDAFETILACSNGCLTAVRGNRDLSLNLPLVAAVQFEDVTFVATHGVHGTKPTYEHRVVEIVREETEQSSPIIGVCGHTHKVLDTTVSEMRLLNPGSATGMYPAREPTIQLVTVNEETVSVQTLTASDSPE